MRRIAVLDAPSNLGLRPPTVTSVPGCAKAPGALRDHGLLTKLNARDAGCLTPPRYDVGDWRPGDGVAMAPQIAAYSRALADRIGAILDAGEFPVILGGDCSILLGSGVAMHRLGESVGGRIGLVFVDGHSDFRHPGNASYVGAAAGEDLALVTGRGQADLAAIEGRRPYFRDVDVVVMGIRAQDEYRLDLQAAGIVTRPVPALRAEGAARSAQWAREQLVDCAGYWVHMDVDVLDPAVMPAVDAPSPGGIAFPELEILLAGLVESPHCLGVEITVFDPDYDTDGSYASEIVNAITAGLANAHTVPLRPDLVAARADLNNTEAAAPAPEPDDDADQVVAGSPGSRASLDQALGLDGSRPRLGGLGALRTGLERSRPDSEPEPDTDDADSRPAVTGSSGLLRPRSGVNRVGRTESLIAGFNRGDARPGGLRRPQPAAATEPDDAERERRANAAASSVALAAAGMSEGIADDVAIPDSTLAGVDEAGEIPAEAAAYETESDPADVAGAVEVEPTAVDSSRADQPATPGDAESLDEPEPTGEAEPVGEAELLDDPDPVNGEPPASLVPRPLGQAPLLDSAPLPATRPGMLRPRSPEEQEPFSLPIQRPAFDLGSDTPADIT
ncbi:arginase family protein [Actinoplanes bogorensis]|uniref:Arginase family protein n=1 Tax=Paractinoplanes bogorensis TaxID=1610840 RepID=A0ABS5YEZ1_9ACTN|nr:arginase family protein [Actinoplanes bogorensis]